MPDTIRPPIPATCESRPTVAGLVVPFANVRLADGGVDFRSRHESTVQRYEGDEHEHVDRLLWKPANDIEISVWHPGEVQIAWWDAANAEPVNADTARKAGLALLAAANAADQAVTDG